MAATDRPIAAPGRHHDELVRLLAHAPQPTDGPDYHAELAFWKERVRKLGATDYEIEEANRGS